MIPFVLAAVLVHESSVSSSRLDVSGREIRVVFTFSLEDLAALARLDLDHDGKVSQDEWAKVLPLLLAYVAGHFRIESGGEPCLAAGEEGLLPPSMPIQEGRTPVPLEITYRCSREISALRIRCTLFQEHGGNPRHVAEVSGGPVFIFDRDRTESEGTSVERRSGVLRWSSAAILAGLIGAFGLAWRLCRGARSRRRPGLSG